MANKITKRDNFNALLNIPEVASNAELVAFVDKAGKELSIAEIRNHFGITAQKATPILTKLVENGKLAKRVEKRVSYFSVVA